VRVAADGSVGYMPTWSRLASDYLAVALPLGLQVRRCEEPHRPSPLLEAASPDRPEGATMRPFVAGGPPDIWALHGFVAEAANAAWHGNPVAIVWHFERPPT
jgi:hypothetical protein